MKYVLRILVVPFVLGLLVVFYLYYAVFRTFQWVKWGGEVNVYNEKLNRATIQDVFNQNREIIEAARNLDRNLGSKGGICFVKS